MALYVMGDFHLSLSTDKPMDIFGDAWVGHEKKIAANWPLSEEDTIVINGDVSWAMDLNQAAADFDFLQNLPGRKILLKGNHDYWWTTMAKLRQFASAYPSIDFLFNNSYETDECFICGARGWITESTQQQDAKISKREQGRLKRSLDSRTGADKPTYVFLHYPPIFGSERNDDILSVLKEYGVSRCYYGHLHGAQAHRAACIGRAEGIEMHLTACDYLGFIPMRVD